MITTYEPRYHILHGDRSCHLFIINGPDRRESMVQKTCQVALNKVDSITVLDKTDGKILAPFCLAKNVRRVQIPKGFDHQVCFQLAIEQTKINDYLMLLDSDEIPSSKLLTFLAKRKYTKFPEANVFHVNMIHHFYDEFKNVLTAASPKDLVWVRPSLIKRDEGSIVECYGVHSSLSNKNKQKHDLDFELCTIHCKTNSQISYSTLVYSFKDPTHYGIPETSPNYPILLQWMKDNGIDCNDDNRICDMVLDLDMLRSIRSKLDWSTNEPILMHLNRFIDDYKGKLTIYDFRYCQNKCCENLQ